MLPNNKERLKNPLFHNYEEKRIFFLLFLYWVTLQKPLSQFSFVIFHQENGDKENLFGQGEVD